MVELLRVLSIALFNNNLFYMELLLAMLNDSAAVSADSRYEFIDNIFPNCAYRSNNTHDVRALLVNDFISI